MSSPRGLFQIVHLMGSHMTYKERYPQAFNKFTSDSLPIHKGEAKDLVISAYINSLLYTDHIIHEIIERYREENALIIYLSDHGQAVFENPERPDYYEHEVSQAGLMIPLMVYASPALRQEHPEIYEQIVAAKDRKIMTDLLANSICGLLGVKTKYYNARQDFFSSEYDNARRRLVQAYDGQMREF